MIDSGLPFGGQQGRQHDELDGRQDQHPPASSPAARASGATGSDLSESMWSMSPRNAQGSCMAKMKRQVDDKPDAHRRDDDLRSLRPAGHEERHDEQHAPDAQRDMMISRDVRMASEQSAARPEARHLPARAASGPASRARLRCRHGDPAPFLARRIRS